jgi:hypothetical protein
MSQVLNPALFEKLKDLETAHGWTLHKSIQPGVEIPDLSIGIVAGDEESWEVSPFNSCTLLSVCVVCDLNLNVLSDIP